MKEKIITKIMNNTEQIGTCLREYGGAENGIYFGDREKCITINHIFCWQQSFFTGMAYWAYVATKDRKILDWLYGFKQEYYDKVFMTPLETMHDLGFLYIPYAVALYKLTGDEDMKAIGVKAADELAKRFEPRGGYIRAWGRMDYRIPEYVDSELAQNHFFTESQGLAIIDCMMNIPLLLWAGEVTHNKFYERIATVHADTTIKYFVRDDDTVCHAYRFDEQTGEAIGEANYCGYSVGSYWARGAAWAIYGFMVCYKYTGNEKYLDVSLRLFERFAKECNGEIPVWDFRLPDGATPNLDTSAVAIVLSACNELEKYTDRKSVREFKTVMGEKIKEYIDLSLTNNGILKMQDGTNVYASYGDYYLVEALFGEDYPEYVIW